MTNIGIKMTLDASQVASVANTTKDAFLGMADAMKKAQDAGDYKTVSDLAGGMKDLRSASGGFANSDHAQQAPQTKQNAFFGNGVLSTINQAPGLINTMGRGDFAGTAIGGLQGAGNLSRSAGKFFGEKAEAGSDLGKISGLLKGAGWGALAVGGVAAGGNALVGQWEKVMQPAMQMNAMLKSTTGGIEENSKNIRAAFDRAAAGANKFGYAAEEGMQVVMDLSRYGKTENNGVYDSESKILGFERSTNASRGNLTKYEGAMQRYGGGKDALETAYGGTFASGLQKGQFEEFLTSVERIFTEGISKGFVKGANEISSDLAFLSKLSGGSELWKGEQGAQRYSQMSNAISNATSLSSATDIITYRAAAAIDKTQYDKQVDILDTATKKPTGKKQSKWKEMFGSERGGDYVDNQIIIEAGVRPELLKNLFSSVQSLEGEDNRTGQVERFMQMFGLNYTGGAQVYEMAKNSKSGDFDAEVYSKEIAKLKENPEYVSDESKLLVATEKMATAVAGIGENFLPAKTAVLAGLTDIVAAINGGLHGKDIQYGINGEVSGKTYNAANPMDWFNASDRVTPYAKEFNESTGIPKGNVAYLKQMLQEGLVGKTKGLDESQRKAAEEDFYSIKGAGYDFFKLFDAYYDDGGKGDKKIDNLEFDYLQKKMIEVFQKWKIKGTDGKPIGAVTNPSAFQLGANTSDSVFTSDWNADSSSTFARASRNIDELPVSSNEGSGMTSDLIRRLVASMDGLAARFDKGLVVDAYGGA